MRKEESKEKVGFAKVKVSREAKQFAQAFVDTHIKCVAFVNTNDAKAYTHLRHISTDYRVMAALPEALESWMPWVHQCGQNAKSFLNSTYHGVGTKYFERYSAECNYRPNRKYGQNGISHRITGA